MNTKSERVFSIEDPGRTSSGTGLRGVDALEDIYMETGGKKAQEGAGLSGVPPPALRECTRTPDRPLGMLFISLEESSIPTEWRRSIEYRSLRKVTVR